MESIKKYMMSWELRWIVVVIALAVLLLASPPIAAGVLLGGLTVYFWRLIPRYRIKDIVKDK